MRRVLLVRNDNVGDLVCSIPAIQLLRERAPGAEVRLLVNSYNAAVAEPLAPRWVDRLVVYTKTKHAGLGPAQAARLARFYAGLLAWPCDAAFLLVGGESRQARAFARWARARRVHGYGAGAEGPAWREGLHEVEYSWNLVARALGAEGPPPPEIAYPVRAAGRRAALQVTSRKPGNRWPAARFAEVARAMAAAAGERVLLLWSPGAADTPTHPGDDAKAAEIAALAGDAVEPAPTRTLRDLVGRLAGCRSMVTPDGGAMHLAAAMGVRVVAMFGQSEPSRWRPWSPRAAVLRSPTRTIEDIPARDVLAAWARLAGD
jgi:ADP-heptose:LPS heptosyltransferase